jgi:hypothetical protein
VRIRTAKQRAQRIDLYYFKHAHGMRRWRTALSLALPVAAIVWIGGVAAAGTRKPYSAGPVSRSHAFAEARCEMCHRTAATEHTEYTEGSQGFFRRHTTDGACLTCHDAPAHAANQTPPPACATCHRDHRGRVDLAKTDDRFCADCHGDLKTTHGNPNVAKTVKTFPSQHPEFAAVRDGAPADPGQVKFNHAVHLKDTLRGPNGPEKLACTTCHRPEIARAAAPNAKKPVSTGLMAPISYQQQCQRCHPLFFDERVDRAAPHDTPDKVRAFVQQALTDYIRQNPRDISRPDAEFRRVPLNFPRPVEAPARNAAEWVQRREATDERILWNKTCAECHVPASPGVTQAGLPSYAKTDIPKQWMPRAAFDHTPHLMVTCDSCHAAQGSSRTSDVLMPKEAACASCHAPSKGAESRCFECHRYHDWTKTHPVASSYTLTDFK